MYWHLKCATCSLSQRMRQILCFLLGACLFHEVHICFAQEKNASALLLEPDLLGPVAAAQLPPSMAFADTAIVVRYVLIGMIALWDTNAACEPTRKVLNFWGEVNRLPVSVCQAQDTHGELFGYTFLRVLEKQFPEPERLYRKIMVSNGYDPEDRSTDKTTAIGMGNVIGKRISEWFQNDGWNSLGDKQRENFGMPYEDYSGYKPTNSPWELKYPLRWQPLKTNDFRLGRYTYQQHVVPFLGNLRPFVLTQGEFEAKQVHMPHMNVNATELSENDAHMLDNLMKEVLDASKNLTPLQQFLALWWDNKYASLGLFSLHYTRVLKASRNFFMRWVLGEMLAQYDAILLAWKEKVRVDAVRPQSIARELYKDQIFDVFVSSEKGVQSVHGKDWEPLLVTQPHSEFPSGSAAICTAAGDHNTLLLKEEMDAQGLTQEPLFKLDINHTHLLPSITVPDVDIGAESIEFSTIAEAVENCGTSRLWAGVNFSPSIPAGEKLVEGIGEKAYRLVKDLSEGKVPKKCWWCTRP